MDRILRINYGRGKMCINVDTFFPTSRTRIRKLGRIMRMDYEHDGKDELIEMLEDRMQTIEEEWRDLYDSMGERKMKLERDYTALKQNVEVVKDEI